MFNFFDLIRRTIIVGRQALLLACILILYSFYAQANYAPKIVNSNDGYFLRLTNSSTVAQIPTYGSDGKEYYQVGNPISVVNDNSIVSVIGDLIALVANGEEQILSWARMLIIAYLFMFLKQA